MGGLEKPLAITKSNLRPAVFVDPRGLVCTSFMRAWAHGDDT